MLTKNFFFVILRLFQQFIAKSAIAFSIKLKTFKKRIVSCHTQKNNLLFLTT
jgi:hypothetical protein